MGIFFGNSPISKQHRDVLKRLDRMEVELARRYNMLLSGGLNVPRYSDDTMRKTADFGFGFAVYCLLAYLETLDEKRQYSSYMTQAEKDEVIQRFVRGHRNFCSMARIQNITTSYTAAEWMTELDIPDIFLEYFAKAYAIIWNFL